MLEPYRDPVGYPTLGWGSRYDKNMKPVTMGTPAITLDEADYLLYRDLQRFSYIVNRDTYNINQNQFDALVSFCYNIGNINGIKDKVNNGTLTRKDFLAYSFARGQRLQGLVNRRNLEADLYFTPESITQKVAGYISSKLSKHEFTHKRDISNLNRLEDNRAKIFGQASYDILR